MKIEFVTNACFLITFSNGRTLLTDPWFASSCYYGAWHNFPPVRCLERYVHAAPDYLFISHIHPDHFHPPTLDHFDRKTPVLVVKRRHDHLTARLRHLGFERVIELPPWQRVTEDGVDFVSFLDFAATTLGESDGIDYELDSSFLAFDPDGSSVLNVNDNCIQIKDADAIVARFGSPTVSIAPSSGASLYPHAFLNFSDADKASEARRITGRMLSWFLEVAGRLGSRHTIPAAGAYVMGGSIAGYSRYLHQPTPADLRAAWKSRFGRDEGLDLLCEGDVLDVSSDAITPDPEARFRDYTAEERAAYALALQGEPLAHEKVVIPGVFEVDWMKLLPRARRHLWSIQERYENFPDWDVILDITGQFPGHFVFPYSRNESGWGDAARANESSIRFVIDSRLLLLTLLQMAHWNNIEVGALVQVERRPNVFVPAVHNLMSFFHI